MMPEIPYFGKNLCQCGVRSGTNTHFEIHNVRHLSDDITKICSVLMSESKQENEALSSELEDLQTKLVKMKMYLYKFCEIPPKDVPV